MLCNSAVQFCFAILLSNSDLQFCLFTFALHVPKSASQSCVWILLCNVGCDFRFAMHRTWVLAMYDCNIQVRNGPASRACQNKAIHASVASGLPSTRHARQTSKIGFSLCHVWQLSASVSCWCRSGLQFIRAGLGDSVGTCVRQVSLTCVCKGVHCFFC